MGRWELKASAATTVNSGASILIRFYGHRLKALFDVTTIIAPAQIYASIDKGEKRLLIVNGQELELAPEGLEDGAHTVEIEVKDVSQNANRWTPPLEAAVIFSGFALEEGGVALAPDPALVGRWSPSALRMEFYGDSITQGVRVLSMATGPEGSDGTRTYSYLTSLAFDANITQVGFGAQGVTHGGWGGVPSALDSFAYNFAGSPVARGVQPDVVVINQGTNDIGVSAAVFGPAYISYLQRIRAAYPHVMIFAMRPFNGCQNGAIQSAVATMHDPQIRYVDTNGWLELSNPRDYTEQPTGLHPSVVGHVKAAERLIAVLRAAGVGAP
jgi:lysophospholipase L1-like esterase